MAQRQRCRCCFVLDSLVVVSVIATSCGSHRSEGTCLAAGVSSRQAPHLSLAGSYGPQSRNNHSWTPQRSCISRLWDILSIHGILLHILPVASFPSCGLQKIPLQLILHLQPLVFLFIVLYVFLVLSNPAENQTLWAKEKTVLKNTVFLAIPAFWRARRDSNPRPFGS